jgi:hypothetical protein
MCRSVGEIVLLLAARQGVVYLTAVNVKGIQMKRKNNTGKYFGRLYVLGFEGVQEIGCNTLWKVLCECGKIVIMSNQKLMIKGKYRVEACAVCGHKQGAVRRQTHNKSRTKMYHCYYIMMNRCRNPNVDSYPHYGGRGIKVCERWHSYENFYNDMGERPEGMSIERVDANGDYCPENCKWATNAEQQRNKTNNRYLTVNGEKKLLIDWAKEYRIPRSTMYSRLDRGWSDERAVTQPLQKRIARIK